MTATPQPQQVKTLIDETHSGLLALYSKFGKQMEESELTVIQTAMRLIYGKLSLATQPSADIQQRAKEYAERAYGYHWQESIKNFTAGATSERAIIVWQIKERMKRIGSVKDNGKQSAEDIRRLKYGIKLLEMVIEELQWQEIAAKSLKEK